MVRCQQFKNSDSQCSNRRPLATRASLNLCLNALQHGMVGLWTLPLQCRSLQALHPRCKVPSPTFQQNRYQVDQIRPPQQSFQLTYRLPLSQQHGSLCLTKLETAELRQRNACPHPLLPGRPPRIPQSDRACNQHRWHNRAASGNEQQCRLKRLANFEEEHCWRHCSFSDARRRLICAHLISYKLYTRQ